MKGDFENNMLSRAHQEPFGSFIEGGHFKCFDARIIMHDKVKEYELDDTI